MADHDGTLIWQVTALPNMAGHSASQYGRSPRVSTQYSMSPRASQYGRSQRFPIWQVTAPLAIAIAGLLGADPSLAATIVVITGLVVANFGAAVLDALKVRCVLSQ